MHKAIIIDDERLARNELKKLLSDFPEVEVIGEAANAAEGIEKIESLMPDLIFLDINMPLMSGIELLAEIKKRDTIKNIPVIIFSTAPISESLAKILDAKDYVTKPSNFNELKNILKGIL